MSCLFCILKQLEKEYASDYSSAINDAYQTLSHPLKRAEYLLHLNHQKLQEGEVSWRYLFSLYLA